MRSLSDKFIANVQEGGLFNSLLERVKKDSTLCLEIRENYINIYYRGGNIMRVEEKNDYISWFDKKYCLGNVPGIIKELPEKLMAEKDVCAWITAFPSLKQAMDFWFNNNPKDEREFQQLFVRENNGFSIGNSTDYFVIDIEYDNHKGARFDLVTIQWDSQGSVRKLTKGHSPKLCFIEMKYADGALGGTAGMVEHIKDFQEYFESSDGLEAIRKEMQKIFDQKRQLGLIPALKNNKNDVKGFTDEVDFIFLLANHDPESDKLKKALYDIKDKYGNAKLGFNLRFCTSNFLGYGLYRQNIYSLSEFQERFSQQIACKS